MTSPDPAAEGRRRADQFLTLLTTDDAAAGSLLESIPEIRDLVFLGAGLRAGDGRESRPEEDQVADLRDALEQAIGRGAVGGQERQEVVGAAPALGGRIG